jgi:hypothetical protein
VIFVECICESENKVQCASAEIDPIQGGLERVSCSGTDRVGSGLGKDRIACPNWQCVECKAVRFRAHVPHSERNEGLSGVGDVESLQRIRRSRSATM